MSAIQVMSDELTRIVSASARASAKDDSRPVLAGIYMEFNDAYVTASGADGFRITESQARLMQETDEPYAVILQPKPLLAFLKTLSKKTDLPVSITPGAEAWTFEQMGSSVTVPVIDGTFPDCKQLIGGGEMDELFHVNASYLKDVLSAHGQEMVSFGRGANSKVGAASPIYITQKDPYSGSITRHVVMPMIVEAR